MPAAEDRPLFVLGRKVRKLRQARGLTLREATALANALLPEEAGLSLQVLSAVERNGQPTTTEKFVAIVRALGGRVDILTGPEPVEVPALPAARAEVARAFLQVLPHLPEDEVDVFIHELRLWARRYEPKEG